MPRRPAFRDRHSVPSTVKNFRLAIQCTHLPSLQCEARVQCKVGGNTRQCGNDRAQGSRWCRVHRVGRPA